MPFGILKTALNAVSAAAALLAAVLWFWSARVRLPDKATVGYGGTGGTQDDVLAGLKRQSRLSGLAAICAGLSASAQAFGLVVF